MKSLLNILVVTGLAFSASLSAEPANKKCLVTGKPVDPEVTVKHSVVLGFCCDKCPGKFKENPLDEKYKGVLKEAAGKPVNTVCPVSGREIDAEKVVAHEGKMIGFCCGKCVAKFKKDSAGIAAKVKVDHPGNAKCPVSGKDVDPATAEVFTGEVGFCCEKCQKKFKEDPGAVIAKAKEAKKE